MNPHRLAPTLVGAACCLMLGCGEDVDTTHDYKQYMREFVQDISAYAKARTAGFIVIPQNGQELLSATGEENGAPEMTYIGAIDGVGREDLFYGYDEDNEATPAEDRDYMLWFTDLAEANGVQVLTTDYCSTPSKMDDSYIQNVAHSYISFAADSRELDRIPSHPAQPYRVNTRDITTLDSARNFLYLICPDNNYATKDAFLSAVRATDYDAVIIDAFYVDSALDTADIASLKTKAGGGTRLVICYMSIGEAEDYRFYWRDEWYSTPPSWMAGENPAWPGNYKVRYWDPAWQALILGSADSYLDRILAAGFDGVYLDIIDAFEYFENSGKWWYPY
ncbi:MAG: endo alpha-1,4 polygalactosaminidase [Armatimonadetes bacterium]|nr:endo alpha-1,4 polygalactosaminidase [Armatimonadota bacterium]